MRLRNTSSTPPGDRYNASLLTSLNSDRAANGCLPLTWSPKLSNQAGTWAANMAAVNSLYHQNLGALINSSDYQGYTHSRREHHRGAGQHDPAALEAAWMNSPPHKANILSGAFNIVGIGYVRGPDGRIWAVQDFGGI